MLRDLRPGATLFVLDKKERKIGQAVVTNNVQNMLQFNQQMQQVQTVNLSFKYDGRDITFNGVNATAASSEETASGLVVCESNDALLNEIKAYKTFNDTMLAKQQYFEETSKWCSEQILTLDPVEKVKAENEQQLNTMMGEFRNMFNDLKAENAELRSRLDALGGGPNKKGKE